MGHNSHTWATGDVIPANLLNSIENDLAAAAVIADVGTAGTATGDALRAAFVSPRRTGLAPLPTLMAMGDSITANGGGSHVTATVAGSVSAIAGQCDQQYQAVSYVLWARLLSGGRFLDLGSTATAGFTTAQIVATHLPTVLATKPDLCVVLAGTNGSGGTDPAAFIADMTTIFTQLVAAGITPIVCTLPPQDTDASSKLDKNLWLARYAQAHGLPFADFHKALVDPTNGHYRSGYSGDGTHPREVGAKAMGQALADTLTKTLGAAQPHGLIDHSGNSLSLIGNAAFTTDNAGSPAWPIPWLPLNGSGTTTAFTTDPTVAGRLFTLTRGSSDVFVASNNPAFTLTAGHVYRFGWKAAATVKSVGGGAQWRLRDSLGNTLFDTAILAEDVPLTTVLFDYACPSGLASYDVSGEIRAWTASGAAVSIGQFTAVDLTALGIA